MSHPNWQAERKKIFARLAVAIYKMTDEQLISFLHLFDDCKVNNKRLNVPSLYFEAPAGVQDRQMLIARFFLLIHQFSEADLIDFMSRYEQKQFTMLRKHPRVPCNFCFDLAVDGRAINCFATDISAGGVFVESCESFVVGQAVSICFSFDDESLPLKLNGRVVRLENGGAGIKYESLTGYQLEILKDMIARLRKRAHP